MSLMDGSEVQIRAQFDWAQFEVTSYGWNRRAWQPAPSAGLVWKRVPGLLATLIFDGLNPDIGR
jgi:hypothetical protein